MGQRHTNRQVTVYQDLLHENWQLKAAAQMFLVNSAVNAYNYLLIIILKADTCVYRFNMVKSFGAEHINGHF